MGSTRIIYFLFISFVQVYGFPCKRQENIFQKNNIYHTHGLPHRSDQSIQQTCLLLSRFLPHAGFYQHESPATLNSYGGSNKVYQNSVNRINDFDRTYIDTANGIRNENSWNLLNKKAFLLGMNDRFQSILRKNTFPFNNFHSFGWHGTYHGIPYDTHNEDHTVVKKPSVFPQVVSASGIPALLEKDGSKVTDVGVESEDDGTTEKIDKINTDVKFILSNVSLKPAKNIPITENSLETSNANESTTEETLTHSTNDIMTSLDSAVTNFTDDDILEFSDTTFNRLSTEMMTMTDDLFTEQVDSYSSKIMHALKTVFHENFETTESTVVTESHSEITTQRITTDFTTATTESTDNISFDEETGTIETTQFATDDSVVDESSGLVLPLTTDRFIPEATTMTTSTAAVDVTEVIDSLSTLSGILSVVDTHLETTSQASTVDTEVVATEVSSTVDSNMATEFLETDTTMGISITTDLTPEISSIVLLDDNYKQTTTNGPTEFNADENYLLRLIPRVIEGLKNDSISANEKETLSQLYRKLWPYLVDEANRKEDEPMNELLANFLESVGLLGKEENNNWRVKRDNDLNDFQGIKRSRGFGDPKIVNHPIIVEVVSNSMEDDGPIELPDVEDYFDDDYSDYSQYHYEYYDADEEGEDDDDHEDENSQQGDNDDDYQDYDDDFDDDDVFIKKSFLSIFKDDDDIDSLELL